MHACISYNRWDARPGISTQVPAETEWQDKVVEEGRTKTSRELLFVFMAAGGAIFGVRAGCQL